jgi:predicted phosphoadenosine phosphosulfate sulfurtransferase
MKIYSSTNVYEAALNRIRWIYDEFPNVICSVSGGKDSTVIFHLCLQVAREKGRLPLKIMWLDQEAEWQATVNQITEWMLDTDVKPFWYQFPFRLFNATSVTEHWLNCWDKERERDWVHPQVAISFKENNYGTDRFHKLFKEVIGHDQPPGTANIGGVRAEESPGRLVGLTYAPKYKWVTWGHTLDEKKSQYTFYPIYDWSYTDVWKAIFDNKWSYNKIYDAQYRYGTPLSHMRVSNVHHETAVDALFYMQEVEPETYERLVRRIQGIDMAGKMGKSDYFVSELPFMFGAWKEYRDYLLEHLITNPDWQNNFRTWFKRHEIAYGDSMGDAMYKSHISAIMVNDWEGVTMGNYLTGAAAAKGKQTHKEVLANAN